MMIVLCYEYEDGASVMRPEGALLSGLCSVMRTVPLQWGHKGAL